MIPTNGNLTDRHGASSGVAVATPEGKKLCSYVLMTAAHNEEADIENTIKSVLAQSILPTRWLIVSDNSTDRTDEIIRKYADQHSFISFLHIARPPGRNFAAKIIALKKGAHFLEGVSTDFVGNMDADLTVGPTFFEDLMHQFELNPRLGLAGGFVYEEKDGVFQTRGANRASSVSHAAQLVRRDLYEAFGGYAVLPYGGEDWHAQTTVRSMGWEAKSIPELKIYHHRPTGAGIGQFRSVYQLGKLDYSFGTYPAFEIIKCLIRLPHPPFVIGAIVRMGAFLGCMIRREPFKISPELVAFLRNEQKERMLAYVGIRAKSAETANTTAEKGGRG